MSSDRDVSQSLRGFDIIFLINTTVLVAVCIFYANRIFFHPLARVPGPLLAKCTSLWQIYHAYMGDECTAVQRLHRKYGKIVRIGPNLIDIADGAALVPIYLDKRFLKPSSYHNAYTDGFATMFSTTDPAYRGPRAKTVAPLFSKAAVGRHKDLIYQSIERFIQRLKECKSMSKGHPIDLQEHTRALGLDVLASYLFHHRPPNVEEQIDGGSMIPWIDIIVDVGRFFYLPSWLFRLCVRMHLVSRSRKDREAESAKTVHGYTISLPYTDERKGKTFQGRLFEHGTPREQIAAECKSMMFAGTHSSGSILAHTL